MSRPVNAQAIETPPQSKAVGTTQGERVATSDNAGGHKVEPSTAAVGAEGARIGESKVEAGKPVEPHGSRDAGTLRDPKSAGVTNEVFGQKAEVGQRGEVSPSAGAKPD